jgi:hypothetical protein
MKIGIGTDLLIYGILYDADYRLDAGASEELS